MPTKKPEPLTMVNFRADAELLRAIDDLAAAVGLGVTGAKSVAMRRAILEAHARLTASKPATSTKRAKRTQAPRVATLAAPMPATTPARLRAVLVDAVRAHEIRDQFGLLDLPTLRANLEVQAPRADVDAMLLQLERDRKLELKIAQSPATLADRAGGISVENRGLLFYVNTRKA